MALGRWIDLDSLMTAYKEVNKLSALAPQALPLFCSRKFWESFVLGSLPILGQKFPGICSIPGQGFPKTIYSRELFNSRTKVEGQGWAQVRRSVSNGLAYPSKRWEPAFQKLECSNKTRIWRNTVGPIKRNLRKLCAIPFSPSNIATSFILLGTIGESNVVILSWVAAFTLYHTYGCFGNRYRACDGQVCFLNNDKLDRNEPLIYIPYHQLYHGAR